MNPRLILARFDWRYFLTGCVFWICAALILGAVIGTLLTLPVF